MKRDCPRRGVPPENSRRVIAVKPSLRTKVVFGVGFFRPNNRGIKLLHPGLLAATPGGSNDGRKSR